MAEHLRYIEPIKLAKRENRLEDAIALCLKAIKSTEKESRAKKIGVAPWEKYTGGFAIFYPGETTQAVAENLSLIHN